MTDKRDPIIVIVDGRAVIYDIPVGAGLHMHFPGGATVSHERPAGVFDVDIGTRTETTCGAEEAVRKAMKDALANGAIAGTAESPWRIRYFEVFDELIRVNSLLIREIEQHRGESRG